MKLSTINSSIIAAAVLLLPGVASAATMSVSPASKSVKVGDVFTVTIQLDTQGNSIDGIDIRYLNFNPTLIQVVDSNPNLPNVQIAPGGLMALTASNIVDNSSGKILFSQIATGGTKYKGSGVLASVTFKAIKAGSASLVFNYTAKSTTDTNIAAAGADILNAVINGSYAITGAGTAPAPNVTVTPSPTPGSDLSSPSPSSSPDMTGESDNPDFQFSQRRSFWQIFVGIISDFFSSFSKRLHGN